MFISNPAGSGRPQTPGEVLLGLPAGYFITGRLIKLVTKPQFLCLQDGAKIDKKYRNVSLVVTVSVNKIRVIKALAHGKCSICGGCRYCSDFKPQLGGC